MSKENYDDQIFEYDGQREFIEFCREEKITREDGKDVASSDKLDAYATYVREDGKKFKLEWSNGGAMQSDDYGAVTYYQLKEVRQKRKEIVETNVQENGLDVTFDDVDRGYAFLKYCQEHGIKRADGKEISFKDGMDSNALYIGEDGTKYKLKWSGAQGYDDGVYTEYQLFKLEEREVEEEQKKEEPTPDQTSNQTPDQTPDQTSNQTPDQKPDQKPDHTLEKKGEENQTPDQTPDQTSNQTPDHTLEKNGEEDPKPDSKNLPTTTFQEVLNSVYVDKMPGNLKLAFAQWATGRDPQGNKIKPLWYRNPNTSSVSRGLQFAGNFIFFLPKVLGLPLRPILRRIFKSQDVLDDYKDVQDSLSALSDEDFAILTRSPKEVEQMFGKGVKWMDDTEYLSGSVMRSQKLNRDFLSQVGREMAIRHGRENQQRQATINQLRENNKKIMEELRKPGHTPDEIRTMKAGIVANQQMINQLTGIMQADVVAQNEMQNGIEHRSLKYKDTAGHIFSVRDPRNKGQIAKLAEFRKRWRLAKEAGDELAASEILSEMYDYHSSQVKMKQYTSFEYDTASKGMLDSPDIKVQGEAQDIGHYLRETGTIIATTAIGAGIVNNIVDADYVNFSNRVDEEIHNMSKQTTVKGQTTAPGMDTTAATRQLNAERVTSEHFTTEYSDVAKASGGNTLSNKAYGTKGYQSAQVAAHQHTDALMNGGNSGAIDSSFYEAVRRGKESVQKVAQNLDGRYSYDGILKAQETVLTGEKADAVREAIRFAGMDRVVDYTATVPHSPISIAGYHFDPTLIMAGGAAMAIVNEHSDKPAKTTFREGIKVEKKNLDKKKKKEKAGVKSSQKTKEQEETTK